MNVNKCYYTEFLYNEYLPYMDEICKNPSENARLIESAMARNVEFYDRCVKEKRVRRPDPAVEINCLGITITAAPEDCKKIPEIFKKWCATDSNLKNGIYCIENGGEENDGENTHIHARINLFDSTKRDYFVRSDRYKGKGLKGDFGNRDSAKRGLRLKLHKLFDFPTNIVLLHSNEQSLDEYVKKHGCFFDINAF